MKRKIRREGEQDECNDYSTGRHAEIIIQCKERNVRDFDLLE